MLYQNGTASNLHIDVVVIVAIIIINPNGGSCESDLIPHKHTGYDGHHHGADYEARGLPLGGRYGQTSSNQILKK